MPKKICKHTKKELIQLYVDRYYNYDHRNNHAKPDVENFTKSLELLKDEYIDFVYSIIVNKDLLFCIDRNSGKLCSRNVDGIMRLIVTSKVYDGKEGLDTIFHELGHAADYFLMNNQQYNFSTYNGDGTSLYDCILEEFDKQSDKIKIKLLYMLKQKLQKEFNEDIFSLVQANYDNLIRYKQLYHRLGTMVEGEWNLPFKKKPSDKLLAEYKNLENIIFTNKSYTASNEIIRSKSTHEINTNYSVICDLLGYKYNLYDVYGLVAHSINYYNKYEENVAIELFANMFCNKLIKDGDKFNLAVKEFLPMTYSVFEKTFRNCFNAHMECLDV